MVDAMVCSFCGRVVSVNYSGALRQHRCSGPESRTVSLQSGGSVSVSMQINLVKLTQPDRQLLSVIVDALRAFEIATQVDAVDPVSGIVAG